MTCLGKMPSPVSPLGCPPSVMKVPCFKVQGNFLLLCSSTNFVGYSHDVYRPAISQDLTWNVQVDGKLILAQEVAIWEYWHLSWISRYLRFCPFCEWFQHLPFILSSFPKLFLTASELHFGSSTKNSTHEWRIAKEYSCFSRLAPLKTHTNRHTYVYTFIPHTSDTPYIGHWNTPHDSWPACRSFAIQDSTESMSGRRMWTKSTNPVMADHIRFVMWYGLWRYDMLLCCAFMSNSVLCRSAHIWKPVLSSLKIDPCLPFVLILLISRDASFAVDE